MEDKKEMDEITKAITKMTVEATPNRRRSKRVRESKAIKIVKNAKIQQIKEEKDFEEEKYKPKKEEKKEAEISIDFTKNDIIFPLFSTVKYEKITSKFSISYPLFISEWLTNICNLILNSDLNLLKSFSWIVLLYPSLILIKNNKNNKNKNENLNKLISKTILKLSNFMYSELLQNESELSLNDLLICIELINDKNKLKYLYSNFNNLMESILTFNNFLQISVTKKKDIKLIFSLLNCNSSQLINKKTNYISIRNKWESFIGIYTQIVRLHRIMKINVKNNKYLSNKSIENINNICNEFDNKYCIILRDLLFPLKNKTDLIKIDYSYFRYKILAMATHTPTTIVPTFAGYYGYVNADLNCVDIILWKSQINALFDDKNKFINCCNNSVLKNINKKKQFLRILDNICYQSISLLIIYQSIKSNNYMINMKQIKIYYNKLINIRNDIIKIIYKLYKNNLLFNKFKSKNTKIDNILNDSFLTYDKQQKEIWQLHLMSGILLNYWIQK